ncbi:MAG: TonB-dependent receptor [Saprospiraceae bacterium]
MKSLNLTFICLLLSPFVFAGKEGVIQGKILDPQGAGVPFANVLLLAAQDNQLVKGEVSDEVGSYTIPSIHAGEYYIQVSYIGFETYNSQTFALSEGQEITFPTINLAEAANELTEVVVKATKPLIEVKPDKMVFNIEGSINAQGNDAMELLRKSPGVVVDNNDNILLQGKSGVKVYIDGKPSPLSSDDLAAMLKTMQSTEIEAIEIITNPSSKYDAEGNAGIINIKLKKDKNMGANANVDLGYSIGQFANYNGKVSANLRQKDFNLYGSYGYFEGKHYNYMNLYREQVGGVFDQRSNHQGTNTNHSFRLGGDYFLNKKNTIGFLVNGNLSDYQFNADSRMAISRIGSGTIDSFLIANSTNIGGRHNVNANLNYRFDGGNGNTLNIDADYGMYNNDGNELQPNYYYAGDESSVLTQRTYRNVTPTTIDIYTFKVDYEKPMLGGQFGAGIKMALVKTDNTFDVYNVYNGEDEILDKNRSNQFFYSENVNALYANYSKKWNKWNAQVGLRAEQTNSEGDLQAYKEVDDQNVKRHYIDLFPSGGLTYQLNDINSLQLTYSRRIQRPNYQDLNPFLGYLDELTYEKGNPFLKPQYAHNVQLTHTYKYRFNTSLSYSYTSDLITRITDTAGVAASFITWLNLAEQHNVSLTFSAPFQITKWWSSFSNLSGYYTKNIADYGDGKLVNLAATTFNIYAQETFTLPYDFRLEVSGWYNSPSLWGGTFRMDGMGSLDIGIQKKLLNNRANLKVSVSDVLKTNKWHGVSQFGALYMNINGGWDSRRLKVNFSYQLGNNQVKSRNRRTGLEDEQQRIGGEN